MGSVLDEPGVDLERLSVAQYHQMIASGVIDEASTLELLEGLLVRKMTGGPPHADRIARLVRELTLSIGRGEWMIRAQHPITTADSEPEPDLAIVRDGRYDHRHPDPHDIACVVEVADSSLVRDRQSKARIYARAGIARYLIVNLVDRVVEIHTDRVDDEQPRYRSIERVNAGPVDLGPLVVEAADLLA